MPSPSNTLMVPWAYECTPNDMHLGRFSGFCWADACDPATDRHIHRPRYTCSSRPHPMLCNVMRPKSYFAAPRPARRSIWRTSDVGCAFSCHFANFLSKRRLKLFVHCESKKQDTKILPITSPNINRFSNFFTDWLSSKFATDSRLNTPRRLKHVATLPYEMWMSEKWHQSEICIVINDKSQGSRAKHLRNDELVY